MNREQMESAKADLRARFIELERQKTAEALNKPALGQEGIKLGEK